jgi:hypothetical protein
MALRAFNCLTGYFPPGRFGISQMTDAGTPNAVPAGRFAGVPHARYSPSSESAWAMGGSARKRSW